MELSLLLLTQLDWGKVLPPLTIIITMGVLLPLPVARLLEPRQTPRGGRLVAIITGVGLLIVTLLVQPLLQRLPQELGLVVSPTLLLAYQALVSGLLQEGLKLSALSHPPLSRRAAYLGLGFGWAEVLLVVLPVLVVSQATLRSMGLPGPSSLEPYLLSGWERLNVTLFHMAGAVLLSIAWARRVVRWLSLSLVHGVVNMGGVVAIRGYGVVEPNPLVVFYAALTLLNLFLLLKARRLLLGAGA